MTTRRNFLSQSVLAAGAVTLPFACTSPKNNKDMSKESSSNPNQASSGPIALQLWTVREAIEKDLQGTLEQVRKIGFPAVETAFFPEGVTIESAAKALRSADLKVCSIHIEKPVKEEQNRILEMANAYGSNQIIWHGWPEDALYKNKEGIDQLIESYLHYNDFALSNGLELGLHNHWWEFESWENGTVPFEILLQRLPERIFFEIDTYWAKVAGKDPAAVLAKFGDRARFLHIKDGPAQFTPALDDDQPEPMVAVGKGAQDFPAIVKVATHKPWMVVELDNCATDMMTAVKESFDYLTSNGLASSSG